MIPRWYLQVTGNDGCATGGYMKAVGGDYIPENFGHVVYVALVDHERAVQELQNKLDVLNRRIETLIGVTCLRCEKGDPLFVEPDTGFYTHCLGGNYCSAHKLHSLLDTEASQRARAALSKVR